MNKINRFKAGLGFGIAMAIYFIISRLWINDIHTSTEILKSVVTGVIAGAVSGFLFGWMIGLFAKSKFVKESVNIETITGEDILFETPANHFKGLEGVGGKLYLTNKRVIFKSHKLNLQNHQLSINLSDISGAERYKTLGIINNGLAINTRENTTEKFVVESAEEWIKQLANK